MSTATDTITRPALSEMLDLGGRTAIVTGGAMGIGRAICERLHEAGAALVIADVEGPEAGTLSDHLNARRSHSALAIRTDVSVPAEVETMVNAAVRQFGSLDILVNNAGIFPFAGFLEVDARLLEHVIGVNLIGPFMAMQAAARRMIEQGEGGRIINITSIDALHPSMTGLAHYDASKHGLWGLTKNVALELAAHGIAVNAVAPGGVATPGTTGATDPDTMARTIERIPLHRMADPDEIARVVLFLASDLSSYLVGSQIVADGGFLLR